MKEFMGYPVVRETMVINVPSEEQAIALIDEVKEHQDAEGYIVKKSGYVLREKKEKGEVIDSWYIVTCQKDYD